MHAAVTDADEEGGPTAGLGFRELDLPAGTRRSFTRVAPVHGDPVAAWDAQLAEVRAQPATLFHWEMAKLAGAFLAANSSRVSSPQCAARLTRSSRSARRL